MVSIDRVKRGIAQYLDRNLINKMTGWQKWVFGAGAALYLENLSGTVMQLREHPAIKPLGIIDENGNIAVEKVFQHLRVQAQKGPISFDIPMMGRITLSEADVNELYQYIMQA